MNARASDTDEEQLPATDEARAPVELDPDCTIEQTERLEEVVA